MNEGDDGNVASVRQTGETKSHGVVNVAAILLLVSFILFLGQLINLAMFDADTSGLGNLPVSIRASSQADYSRDTNVISIPPISENILEQIIRDMPATGSSWSRMSTLESALLSPVPGATSDHRFTATFTPTQAIGAISSEVPSLASSQTPTPNFTPPGTLLPSKTGTNIVTSTMTPKSTLTITATPTRTNILTTIPTNTLAPNTTVTNTPTPTPTGTNTPTLTPTVTNIVSQCTLLTLSDITLSGSDLKMTITNNTSAPVKITELNINWAGEPVSQNLTDVEFNGSNIVNNANDPSSPSNYPGEKDWTGIPADRELAASTSGLLRMLFKYDLQSTNFSISVTFDNACTSSKVH